MFAFRLPLLTALVLTLTVGCGRKNQAPARVSGMVSYNNRPVTGGTIRFHSQDLGTYQSQLGTDGTYEIADIPVGELVVTVETESLNPGKKPPTYGGGKGEKMYAERMQKERAGGLVIGDKKSAGEYVQLPTKYANPKTSPVTVTLAPGRQVKNIDLAP